MVQLVTHKQDGDAKPKTNVGLEVQAGIQFLKSTETKGKRGTEAVVTLLLRNRRKEQREEERRRDKMAAGLPTSRR